MDPGNPALPAVKAITAFGERFGGLPDVVVRAPGRVNLIGEHTDYNDGFVLPIALDRGIWIAARGRDDRRVELRSLDFHEEASFALDDLERGDFTWSEYLKGVAAVLESEGVAAVGFDGVIAADLPIGAGLSSSAALEMAALRTFCSLGGVTWDPIAMAQCARRAETEWIGVPCGIMDPLTAAAARRGCALLIDCRELTLTHVRFPESCAIVVLDTNTRRGLVETAYEERRAECREAASALGVAALRDAELVRLEARAGRLGARVQRRARHVITENERTLMAVQALGSGDLPRLGSLLAASHRSLQEDFAVSSPALDHVVECATRDPACYGARMTGAGFGGCAVALVHADGVEGFRERVARRAEEILDPPPTLIPVTAGAGVLEISAGDICPGDIGP